MKVVYYRNTSGREPVRDFVMEQGKKERSKIIRNIDYLEDQGYMLHRTHAAKITADLHELRVEAGRDNFRIFYYFQVKDYIVLLHAIKKKTQKLNVNDIKTAENRMLDFIERINKGLVEL